MRQFAICDVFCISWEEMRSTKARCLFIFSEELQSHRGPKLYPWNTMLSSTEKPENLQEGSRLQRTQSSQGGDLHKALSVPGAEHWSVMQTGSTRSYTRVRELITAFLSFGLARPGFTCCFYFTDSYDF